MKKFVKTLAAIAVCVVVSSCATISKPIAATGNAVGSKCGVAESTIILGLWSKDGDVNGIDKAAKSAGITKISHVDSYETNYFFGIVTNPGYIVGKCIYPNVDNVFVVKTYGYTPFERTS